MLKRENRLKKNRHFIYIYRHGETKSLGKIALTFAKTKVRPFKIGFSVSKKIGKSVVRNKVKRRMRSACANLMKNKLFNKSYNYIFIAREGIELMTMNEIENNMMSLLKKAGVINEVC